jgi:hypothetical protein
MLFKHGHYFGFWNQPLSLLHRLSWSWTVLLPSDTHIKFISSSTAVLLPFVTYQLTSPRTYGLGLRNREDMISAVNGICYPGSNQLVRQVAELRSAGDLRNLSFYNYSSLNKEYTSWNSHRRIGVFRLKHICYMRSLTHIINKI